MNNFSLMARFNAWVNGRIYGSAAELTEQAYRADGGAYFGSVHNTLNHIMVVDRLWTRRIEGKDHEIRSLDQILFNDLESLEEARRQEDQYFIDLVDGLGGEDLARPVTYQRIIGKGEETVRCEHVLLTLYNHQTHHRGQVHAMLTRHDVIIPAIDLVYFLDELELGEPDKL